MIERLDFLPTGSEFSYNGKNYVILLREGNMSEVKDSNGKRWAWPSCAKVKAIMPKQYHSNSN